ncbi:hypothetical protein ACPXB1_06365 [Micromonospora sp. DT68]|uniref:hypothetical protein n=1 Tax=Micromonospora sp. DT68 TaxID=3416522 RepID=UPI003CF70361
MREPFPTGEKMDLGNLDMYWQLIEQEFEAIEQLPSLESERLLSARAFDQSQVAGHRPYMAATRYLGVARDNHVALLALLKHHGATLWAPWSLLRPTFETSFFASWLLDPEDGRERRTRGLRCEVYDYYERRKHRAAFVAFPEAKKLIEQSDREDAERGSLKTYREEAAALGQRWDRVHQKINVTDELPKLTFVKGQRQTAPLFEATWRLLSGFEHGLGWALLSGSTRKVEAQIPGGANVQFVINDQEFVNAAKATYFLLLSACQLLRRRHAEPSR